MREDLPRKLRILRAERNLTIRQAAALTGLEKSTFSRLEQGRGKPHVLTLGKIAKGYGVPLEELL